MPSLVISIFNKKFILFYHRISLYDYIQRGIATVQYFLALRSLYIFPVIIFSRVFCNVFARTVYCPYVVRNFPGLGFFIYLIDFVGNDENSEQTRQPLVLASASFTCSPSIPSAPLLPTLPRAFLLPSNQYCEASCIGQVQCWSRF